MSSANLPIAEPNPSEMTPAARHGGWATWAWATIACVLLGASALARAVQERQHKSEYAYKEVCPIDLAKLPKAFGEWHLVDDGEKQLDALTMRITGGSDHLIRTFANRLTGVSVTILILFGPAEPVLPHTPQVCYPASGFSEGESPSDQTIVFSAGKDAEGRPIEAETHFLSASYFKAAGRLTIRQAVYHSYRLDGLWSPYIGMGRKFPRRNPGIFKLQIIRQVAEGESLTKGDPIEQFLSLFLAEFESEIKRAAAAKGAAAK